MACNLVLSRFFWHLCHELLLFYVICHDVALFDGICHKSNKEIGTKPGVRDTFGMDARKLMQEKKLAREILKCL